MSPTQYMIKQSYWIIMFTRVGIPCTFQFSRKIPGFSETVSYYANFVKNYLYYKYQAFNFINSLAIDVLELSNTSNLNGIYFLPQCQLFAVIQTL